MKWLLAVPHLIVISMLSVGVTVAATVSFVITLVTGRYPRPLWEFMAGFHRWTHRVLAYTLLISDRYPPFTLAESPDDAVRLRADYPEEVARWRPLLAWLLVIPFALATAGLIVAAQVCAVVAGVSIVFTRRIPTWTFEVILNSLTWQNQTSFYALWMCEQYPQWMWHRARTV